MKDIITLDYGSGGKKTSSLIDNMILPVLGNDVLDQLGDGAVLEGADRLVFSTDSFVVSPCFFPGGDIGKLSVCGTVNDIAVSGGKPRYLSLGFILEEGFPVEDLQKIIESIRNAADRAGVSVVTGDTKVVERGKGDGIYINTAGIGFLQLPGLSPDRIREGDAVLVSGTVGDHGTAVMLARDADMLESSISSDCAPLGDLCEALYGLGEDLRVLRDPTRGGVATTLNEFTEGRPFSIELEEAAIPVDPAVGGACDMLGLDPLYAANEGKVLAVVAAEAVDRALELMRSVPEGKNAAVIGRVSAEHPGRVIMRTSFGGSRILTKLAGAQLPRIC